MEFFINSPFCHEIRHGITALSPSADSHFQISEQEYCKMDNMELPIYLREELFNGEDDIIPVLLDVVNDLLSSPSDTDDALGPKRRRGGGSSPGKSPNLDRRFREAEERVMRQYFQEDGPPTYNDRLFRRRFRMKRHLFNRIFEGVQEVDDYFTTKTDAVITINISA